MSKLKISLLILLSILLLVGCVNNKPVNDETSDEKSDTESKSIDETTKSETIEETTKVDTTDEDTTVEATETTTVEETTKAETTAETTKAETDYKGDEEVKIDPNAPLSDKRLSDNSSGEINPRIVKTKYETKDVVVASIVVTDDGYAVDPTGKCDSSDGIQKALNDCSKKGGGTVFLPEGIYSVTKTINIPTYVTLRGDYGDPENKDGYGTVIRIMIENWKPKDKNNPFDEGSFMLGGSGGVNGLTIYYPYQSIESVKEYPPVFYTNGAGSNYMASNVQNCTVINGYLGIGACCNPTSIHEQLCVDNFHGTFLYSGAEVYNQADVGTWQNVKIDNSYWINAKSGYTKADKIKLDGYTKENTVGLILGDLEWTEFENLKISDCKIGIKIVKGKRIEFAGSLNNVSINNCRTGLIAEALDDRWGLVMSNSFIDGNVVNKTGGLFKLCNVEITGTKSGHITLEKTDTSGIKVETEKSYVKPAENLTVLTIKKTSVKNPSDIIQAALDEMGKTGGIVYLPGGTYRCTKPITVPAGVELRGTGDGVNRCQRGAAQGTIILCQYGDGEQFGESDPAFITLAGENAGVNGIRIVYNNNGPADTNLNTTYAIRGTAKGVYVVNSTVSAAAYGIDFRGCDNHIIKKVCTGCYEISYRLGGKNGSIGTCLQNGTVIVRTNVSGNNQISEVEVFDKLFDPIMRKRSVLIFLDGAENEQVYNTFCYGCKTLINCKDSKNIKVVNVGADNIGGVQITMNGGSMQCLNVMRYNGTSYDAKKGNLELYNRLTIGDKNEITVK